MNTPSFANRRTFVKSAALAAAAGAIGASPFSWAASSTKNGSRLFKMCLNPGPIGVKANQKELLDYAIAYGYEAMTSSPKELMNFSNSERSELLDKMDSSGISWGSTGLPVDFRKDEETFQKGIIGLSGYARTLKSFGATRMNTWIMPTHPELHYNANMKQHASRLRQCARIVGDSGVKLGLEYVGPKTLMARDRFSFVRTMVELRELISNIGESNVGLVLDSFHWFCAEDTEADILALSNEDVVTVDLNDARSDLSRDEQIDNTRELPMATGVIDLKTFMNALVKIGYDGPVRAEPFNASLRRLDNETALKVNHEAMSEAFALVGK